MNLRFILWLYLYITTQGHLTRLMPPLCLQGRVADIKMTVSSTETCCTSDRRVVYAAVVIMITVMLNIMIFCVMMDMVICGLPPTTYGMTDCDLYDEMELAMGRSNCPRGRHREYTAYQLPCNGPSHSADSTWGDFSILAGNITQSAMEKNIKAYLRSNGHQEI